MFVNAFDTKYESTSVPHKFEFHRNFFRCFGFGMDLPRCRSKHGRYFESIRRSVFHSHVSFHHESQFASHLEVTSFSNVIRAESNREEHLLFLRERGNGVYGTTAYFLSVLLFDLIPLRVLPPMFFAVLSYWMMDLHPNCASCIAYFILVRTPCSKDRLASF